MTIYEILAQIAGTFALIFIVLGYQTEKRKNFLLMCMLADFFFLINFALLGAFSGMATSLISVFKALIFYNDEIHKRRTSVITLILIEIVIVIAGIFTFDGIVSLIPIIVSFAYTIGQWQEKLEISYLVGIMAAILLTVYHMAIGAYTAALSSTLELISSSVGYMKLVIKGKASKNKSEEVK